MALHTNLPIYRVASDLLSAVIDIAKNMPRGFRASIGDTLRDDCVAIATLIFRANCARDKTPHLDALIERLEVVNLLLRLSCDKKLISPGQYAKAIALTGNAGKQAGGWRRSALSPAS